MYYDYINVTTHSHTVYTVLYLLSIVLVWVLSPIVLLTLYNLCMSLEKNRKLFMCFLMNTVLLVLQIHHSYFNCQLRRGL